MGVVANVKNKLASVAKNVANGVADGISKAAQLSQKQLADIEKKKRAYLTQLKDMNSPEGQEAIMRMLGTLGIEVYHAYLPELNTVYSPISTVPYEYPAENRIAFFDITKWVFDAEENYLDKLVNVYHVLSQENCTIALIFHRTKTGCNVTMAVVNNKEDPENENLPSFKDTVNSYKPDSAKLSPPSTVQNSVNMVK